MIAHCILQADEDNICLIFSLFIILLFIIQSLFRITIDFMHEQKFFVKEGTEYHFDSMP